MSARADRQGTADMRTGHDSPTGGRKGRETPTTTRLARKQEQNAIVAGESPTIDRETHAAVLTVRVPMNLRRRSGRKLVVVPGDGSATQQRERAAVAEGSALVKLLARAFYWKRLFDSGEYISLEELAAAENVDRSYLSKVLRLTLLAPSIIEAIVEGREPQQLTIETLLVGVPVAWPGQMPTIASTGLEVPSRPASVRRQRAA